jgi:hypothetical protein
MCYIFEIEPYLDNNALIYLYAPISNIVDTIFVIGRESDLLYLRSCKHTGLLFRKDDYSVYDVPTKMLQTG